MKALILAAGYATRLHPLTENTPKPLLSVAGTPMIEHILHRVQEVASVDEVFVVTNNKYYPQFVSWKKKFSYPKPITILNDGTMSNEDRLGAVGDIHFVIQKQKINDELMVIAGDNLFEFSLLELERFFRQKKASVIALSEQPKDVLAKKLGVVEIDQTGKIAGLEEKPAEPKTNLANTACYIFTRKNVKALERCIAENKKPDNLGDFIKWLSERECVYGFVFKERWFDIGSHEQYHHANTIFGKKQNNKMS
ncbi:nucleotidyltransferase family protein [Candidatus Woesearchaeota archaeon]|nr:nucleotidyltransferase family protein [Candidatus Woesearchaeota archaeon]